MIRTNLNAHETISKADPRIELRGRLDELNARIIVIQTHSMNQHLINDLEEVREVIIKLLKCEVKGENFGELVLWGLHEDEIHTRSHNPAKHYDIGHIMPHRDMKRDAAEINLLRTIVREAELSACRAFGDYDPGRIIHILNRLSSALYILMYKYLPHGYDKTISFSK